MKSISNNRILRQILGIVIFLLALANAGWSSNDPIVRKELNATRIGESVTIDGVLTEEAWKKADVATNFTQFAPRPGDPASEESEVYLLYDEVAVYIGAHLYDRDPQKILKEFTERDQEGNYDWFGVLFDTYQDGQNAFAFLVSAAGTQTDIRVTNSGDDKSWDAVWESAVTIVEDGWIVEFKIPFSMLRFAGDDEMTWRINFGRTIRKNGEESYWNPVRPDIQGLVIQSGILNGINDVKSSVRLMLTPYVISYLNESHHRGANVQPEFSGNINGGLDLKYGISRAFTLDAILIPDFGQVQLDDQVLNLGPFEVFFNENRQFFTEGVELFNKSGLFYSRRIGGRPFYSNSLQGELKDGEHIVSNPLNASLLNATKITGRTNAGTGIGFFNAIEGETRAIIRAEDGTERSVLSGPRTNYNLLVIDQNLPNAGFVTLTNTNVLREGGAYDANVTALNYQLRDKKQNFSLSGGLFYNTRQGSELDKDGYSYRVNAGKIGGNFRGTLSYTVESIDYNINDLGFLRIANRRQLTFNGGYYWFKPFGPFQSSSLTLFAMYLRLHEPNIYSEQYNQINLNFILKNQASFGFEAKFEFIESHDYYEPRTRDFSLYFLEPKNFGFGTNFNSDPRKPLRAGASFDYRRYLAPGRHRYFLTGYLTYQANNHLTASFDFDSYTGFNDVGFVTNYQDGVILGIRDQNILENTLGLKYAFNERLSMTLRLRHYWTKVKNDAFGDLQEDGYLLETDYTGQDENGNPLHDFTVDFFNTDLRLIWRYAPGSDISFVWKQSISEQAMLTEGNYFSNLSQLGSFPHQNNFSIRINYFLDYAYFKRGIKQVFSGS